MGGRIKENPMECSHMAWLCLYEKLLHLCTKVFIFCYVGDDWMLGEAFIVSPRQHFATWTKFYLCLNDVYLKHSPKNTSLVEFTRLNVNSDEVLLISDPRFNSTKICFTCNFKFSHNLQSQRFCFCWLTPTASLILGQFCAIYLSLLVQM